MVHIELVTGKSIRVKGILVNNLRHKIMTSGPILKLTMVTSERVSSNDFESKEQEIFLHQDKIIYFYEL